MSSRTSSTELRERRRGTDAGMPRRDDGVRSQSEHLPRQGGQVRERAERGQVRCAVARDRARRGRGTEARSDRGDEWGVRQSRVGLVSKSDEDAESVRRRQLVRTADEGTLPNAGFAAQHHRLAIAHLCRCQRSHETTELRDATDDDRTQELARWCRSPLAARARRHRLRRGRGCAACQSTIHARSARSRP